MKATDALLADHRMIRKLLADFHPDNSRFAEISLTVHRVIAGHAWFEDQIFLPAVAKSPLLARQFTAEIAQEHKDIETMLSFIRNPSSDLLQRDAYLKQFLSLMDTHFKKEEDGLFPVAERILDAEGLNRLGEEMRARQTESRAVFIS